MRLPLCDSTAPWNAKSADEPPLAPITVRSCCAQADSTLCAVRVLQLECHSTRIVAAVQRLRPAVLQGHCEVWIYHRLIPKGG